MSTLETNEARRAILKDVRYGYALQPNSRGVERVYRGYVFECPRCGWTSRAMKHRYGAEHRGVRHSSRSCPDAECESRFIGTQLALELHDATETTGAQRASATSATA